MPHNKRLKTYGEKFAMNNFIRVTTLHPYNTMYNETVAKTALQLGCNI